MRTELVAAAFVLGLAALTTPDADAGACGGHLQVTAPPHGLARDGVVLLDASEDLVTEQALPGARFVGGGAVVPARVVRTLRGGRLQVLLAADGDLPADAVVHLEVGVAAVDERLASFALPTAPSLDAAVPRWTRAPKVGKRARHAGHKGDSSDTYAIRVALDEGALVLATITTATSTAQAVHVVSRGAIEIGRTGCNSMWSPPRPRAPVEVELRALGAAGQEEPAPGKPLRLRF